MPSRTLALLFLFTLAACAGGGGTGKKTDAGSAGDTGQATQPDETRLPDGDETPGSDPVAAGDGLPVQGELPAGEVTSTLTAKRIGDNLLRINCEFGEWRLSNAVALSPETIPQTGGKSWAVSGAGDLSGAVAVLWDYKNLYLGAKITDDTLNAPAHEPSKWYFDDSLSLFFDLNNKRAGSDWTDGDSIFSFVVDAQAGEVAVWWRRGRAGGAEEREAPAEVQACARRAEGGYEIEAKIPLRVLADNNRLRFGREAGFTILLSDGDAGEDVKQLMWVGTGDDKAGWGRLVFDKHADADADGWEKSLDCDDASATIHPGAAEVAGNGKDDDCDGVTDEAGTGEIARPRTFFQTNVPYNSAIDIAVDIVAPHQHNGTSAIGSWLDAGKTVYKMFFSGSDADKSYVEGRFDGRTHYEDQEMKKNGEVIGVDGRPYIVPSPAWTDYCKDIIRRSIDSGAAGILPEEPLLHGDGGYSDGFKQRWQEFYGGAWQDQQASVNAFWKSSKLKAELYFNLEKDLAEYTKSYARQQGKSVEFYLPVHGLVSFAASEMVFPHGRSVSLLPGAMDGMVAQVWTWPVKAALGKYNGREDTSYFESAFTLYSHFANLAHGNDLKLFFLADPVDDNPSYTWDQYRGWYEETVLASLFFPWVARYEVMPWPDRVFLPGYQTGGGTPGPMEYRQELLAVFRALDGMGEGGPVEDAAAVGEAAFIVGDTIMWERGYDRYDVSMDSFHGPVLPLLKAGVPVQIVPAERAVEAGYLSRFKMIFLTYDMWKPLDQAFHARLAEWVRQGGTLVYFGGIDEFNDVDEWWKSAGFASPQDHLFTELGIGIDVRSRKEIQSLMKSLVPEAGVPLPQVGPILSLGKNVVLYELTGATKLYSIEGEGGAPVFKDTCGAGKVIVAGFPASFFAKNTRGSETLLAFAAYAYPGTFTTRSYFKMKRGRYVAARSLQGAHSVTGKVLNLFSAGLPVSDGFSCPAGKPCFLYEVTDMMQGATPRLLFSNQRISGLAETAAETSFTAYGPEGVDAVARLYAGGKSVETAEPAGRATASEEAGTVKLTFPGSPGGIEARVRWR